MTSDRWLVLGSHIPPSGHLGGMVRYTVEMLKALDEDPTVEVHVHCRRQTTDYLVDELGIATKRLHPTASGSAMADSVQERFGLRRLIRSVGASVVFGSKHVVPRSTGALRLLTVHDMLPLDRPADFAMAKRLLLPATYLRSIRDADVLACVSRATRERLVTVAPDVANRVFVVANAMTPTLIEIAPLPLPGLVPGSFALVVGDRSPRKNVGFVLDLWSEVMARCPEARLVLVGPPGWGVDERLPHLRHLVEAGAVIEAGQVSDAQLRWAYENAAVTLCPSRLEGFGLPVIEALELGCPVIHSADPAQVEAAEGRGRVFDLDNRRGWIDAIAETFEGDAPVGACRSSAPRTWQEAAAELVEVTRLTRLSTATPGPTGSRRGRRS